MTPLITCFARLAKFVKSPFSCEPPQSLEPAGMGATEGLSFATLGNGRDLGSSTATTLRELAAAMDSTDGVYPD